MHKKGDAMISKEKDICNLSEKKKMKLLKCLARNHICFFI